MRRAPKYLYSALAAFIIAKATNDCGFLGIPNQGPCPPKSNPRQGRDHDPARETACVHEFTGHGGNGRAFWVQCCGCKMHLECYPQSAPGMMKVINMLNDFKDEEARIKGWKPRTAKTSSKKKEETETGPTATSRTASTSPRTSSRTKPRHQDNRCQKDELEEETEDWEQLDDSPRSKALTALRELLQDENANATTNQLRLLEKLSDKQNSVINKSINQTSDFEDLTQAVEAAIPESSAFVNQVALNFEPELDHPKGGDRAEGGATNKEIPPKDIYNTKLREKIGKEMLTFISDVAIKQAVNGRYCYYEQDMNSRDWEDPLIKKLKRLPDIGEDRALRKGRKYFSNLPKEAIEYAKLLSQEFVNRPPHTALGDIDDSLQELVGVLVRTIIKMKTTKELGKQIEDNTGPHVKQQVQKIHENMGHCSNENLVVVLKYGKARQAFVEAAQKLERPSCEANKRSKLAKPSKAPTTYQFNDVIGMDIFFVLEPENTTKVPMLNIVCHGTGHQVVIPLPSRHGPHIRRHYRAFWKRVYGVPRMIVIDGEKGFSAGEFPEAAEGDGSEIKVTSATSPWQAGKTERAGGTWKETFYRTRQKFNTNNWEDFYELVDAVNVVMGESVRRGGFTPYQRIFGRPFRLPEKILEEGSPSWSTVSRAMNGDTELARSIDMRKAAMAAYIEAECSEKWRRALQRRTRPTRGTTFQPGDRCYFWRSSTDKLPTRSWHGPARVIQVGLPSTVWCSYQGVLKCSPEQLRHANEAEVAAWEQIDNTMKEELNTENRGRRTHEDLTRQDQPPDDLEVPHVAPPEPAADDQGAASQPPTTEIEKAADVNPELIPMATKNYDHLDDVPLTIKQNINNPISAIPVSERIAVTEAKINKEAEAPPKKKVKKVKAPVVSSAMLTNTNQRLRKEITEKSLLITYKYQPYIAAKRREWGNITNAQAIRLLPPAEADKVRQDPDRASRIMGSRWVLTDMGANPEEVDASKRQLMFMSGGIWRMAKASWTVQGHTDPDLLDLETYSPVVGKDSVFLILQILCSNKWTLQLADITSAFTAGDPLDRSQGSLYVELPRTGIPDVEDGSLVELLKAMYGLGDAPLQWLSAFTKYAKEIGFQCSIFDSCVFYLRDEKGLHGIMGLTVDDIVGGGDVLFDAACQKLRERFPFRAWRHNSGKYTGKELQQNEDNTEITISPSFSSSSIQLINIATERRKEPHSAVTPEGLHQARRLCGSISFLARESRPDLSGPVSLLQGKMPNLVVDDLLEANRIGRMTKEFSSVILRIRRIPFHEMAFAVFNDAAWANARDGASQAGCIVFATQRKILKGEPAIISIQSWKSHKLKRKCAHQFGAETLAISEGMAMGELMRTMLLEITDSEFDLMRPYMLASKFPVISVTDSRRGYDHDKRAAIDVAIVRAAMQRPEVHLRWIEGTSQLTDPLTKRKGESALLRQALHDGEYGITADSIVLRRRYEDRVRRHKKEPVNFAVTDCCFSGLHFYEMDCLGTSGVTSNVDDLNYEPEAYKRLRETQQIFRERPEASRLNQARMSGPGFATFRGISNPGDDAGKVDERFLFWVRDALAQDVKQMAMDAVRDVAIEAAIAAASKQFAQVNVAAALRLLQAGRGLAGAFCRAGRAGSTVSSSISRMEQDRELIKQQVQDLSKRMGIAEQPATVTNLQIQAALRQLPPTECHPTIRLNTEDFVPQAEGHVLVIRLSKAAKVAESRVSTMGSAVDENFTVRLDGMPAAAAMAVQGIFGQCRDNLGRSKTVFIDNPRGKVKLVVCSAKGARPAVGIPVFKMFYGMFRRTQKVNLFASHAKVWVGSAEWVHVSPVPSRVLASAAQFNDMEVRFFSIHNFGITNARSTAIPDSMATDWERTGERPEHRAPLLSSDQNIGPPGTDHLIEFHSPHSTRYRMASISLYSVNHIYLAFLAFGMTNAIVEPPAHCARWLEWSRQEISDHAPYINHLRSPDFAPARQLRTVGRRDAGKEKQYWQRRYFAQWPGKP
ncbi:unnamed protein product [Prorocentrum cordatum]|uniref:Integrase catalytic domain-containing protein n=1 Tax=Prorocentrum cordatum TaxID=2364126 RepID=A0ABN9T9S6_9DINO|nr:unnamed protein product [Polarella glacialis]